MTDPLIRNIQQRIVDAGYPNLQAFAQQSGIGVNTLKKWIQGQSRPSKKSLEKLAVVLECSVEDFTKQSPQPPANDDKDRTIEKLKKLVELQEQVIAKLEHMLHRR